MTDPLSPASAHASIGREDLLSSCEQALSRGINLIVTGPAGVGKTTVVQELVRSAATRGDLTLMCAVVPVGPRIPGAALTELVNQIPSAALNQLTAEQRATLSASGRSDVASLVDAWTAALRACAAGGRHVLVSIDNAAGLDELSLNVLAVTLRSTTDLATRVILCARRMPPVVVRVAPSPAQHVEIPPLSGDAVATLLERYGLPAKSAGPLHVDSGGNPSLLIALAGAMSHRHLASGTPDSLSPMITALVHDRLDGLDDDTMHTLQLCALAVNPTLRLLERSGRVNAAEEINAAADSGIITRWDDTIQFTPSATSRVILTSLTGQDRVRLHALLADAVSTREERLRHLALASTTPDSGFAREVASAGHTAHQRGDFALAAELFMLAADRSEVSDAEVRGEWLVTAANLAAATGNEALAQTARERVLTDGASAEQRVKARLSAVRIAGHNTTSIQQALATAQEDAREDPQSLTSVMLWQAGTRFLSGDFREAMESGDAAANQAMTDGDMHAASIGLSISATAARTLGIPTYSERITKAVALETEPVPDRIHLSAQYFQARMYLMDDQLNEASEILGRLLALAERGGPVERVGVMRSILEVDLRRGRCAKALQTAKSITDIAARNGLSPGPAWMAAALAEVSAGSLVRAAAYATQGARACEQDKDIVFVRPNLFALGHAHLRAGRPADALQVLRSLADLDAAHGVVDPTSTRYHADYAASLVAVDDCDGAMKVINTTRDWLSSFPQNRSVAAMLDRSEALVHTQRGNFDVAEKLIESAVAVFGELQLPLEKGHTLLVHGQVARQRRRYAAARTHAQAAEQLFRDAGARTWLAQCGTFRSHLDGHASERTSPTGVSSRSSTAAQLTEAELRIARLVARGATNKEISQQLYLSVKTVEATLTRVYRKVGVRSRTQLGAQLGFHIDH